MNSVPILAAVVISMVIAFVILEHKVTIPSKEVYFNCYGNFINGYEMDNQSWKCKGSNGNNTLIYIFDGHHLITGQI